MLRAETKALLKSSEFSRSPVMSQLLSYLVEEAITNPDTPPKAYQVAVDGLGRTEDFDVQSDSYPRVQVGRLRKILAAHYAALGTEERLRIPIGHYAVELRVDGSDTPQKLTEFKENDDVSITPPRKPKRKARLSKQQMVLGLVALLTAIGLTLIWWLYADKEGDQDKGSQTQQYVLPPRIYIASAQRGLIGEDRNRAREIELFFEHAFAGSSQVRLAAVDVSNITARPKQNAYLLESQLVAGVSGSEIKFSLSSLMRNETIWSTTIPMPGSPVEYPEKLGPIVSRIASAYGVIATDQREHMPNDAMIGYACLLRFENYRANRDPELMPIVDSCIAQSLLEDPLDSRILAAASLMTVSHQLQLGKEGNFETALQFARRALIRGREDASANFALARSSFFSDSCARGKEFAEKAIELNPYEATLQAQIGAHLLGCHDPDGINYLRQAVALDPGGSLAAETGLVLALLTEDKKQEALQLAEKIIPSSTGIGPYYDITMAMVYAENGRMEEAQQSWDRLVENYGNEKDESPEQLIRRVIMNPALINQAIEVLVESEAIR
ncbi:hypothetical protein [Parasphingorhabdus sp.]|uniref:tetratricopeptide repeat protein n=1 Tax=Parasphingorhabdus sp. TaxID=2709688 RepID=UPI0032669593